jgi:hypothetical protein
MQCGTKKWKKPSGEIASDCTTPANVQKTSGSSMVILQTEWFAKNLITVIPAKAGIHTTPG